MSLFMKSQTGNYLVALTMLLCLMSCKTINNGTITKKKFSPPRTLYANGVYNQTKAKYWLIIEGKNARKKLKKQKIYVSKQTFDSLYVGHFYHRNNKTKEPGTK